MGIWAMPTATPSTIGWSEDAARILLRHTIPHVSCRSIAFLHRHARPLLLTMMTGTAVLRQRNATGRRRPTATTIPTVKKAASYSIRNESPLAGCLSDDV